MNPRSNLWFTLALAFSLGCSGTAGSGSTPGGEASLGGQVASAGRGGLGGAEPSLGGSQPGGTTATGGSSNAGVGGTTAAGGTPSMASGGAITSGGSRNVGGSGSGNARTGGASATGGLSASTAGIGGSNAGGGLTSGGTSNSGASTPTGGTSPVGGSKATGGVAASGGTGASGGLTATGGSKATGGSASIDGPARFHCVNWADPRDNYVDGLLALSGLSSSTDTYATVQSKATDILGEFQSKLQANAIRIPINEPTVQSPWWNAYKAVVDTAVSKGMKVVIAYWAFHNGKPDDAAAFKAMWQVVVTAYASNNLVYFDIHNEPYGYAGSAWNDAAATWLSNFPSVPKGRVIVAGTGYDDDVKPVGADSRFAGCILQLHIYGFWHDTWTAQQQWTTSMNSALGSYAARTLVGEWGAPMTTSIDYTITADGDAYRSYVRAVSDVMHNNAMGSCYWPGLRNGDSYSMTKLNTNTTPLTLTVNSTSGLGRLHWAWQM